MTIELQKIIFKTSKDENIKYGIIVFTYAKDNFEGKDRFNYIGFEDNEGNIIKVRSRFVSISVGKAKTGTYFYLNQFGLKFYMSKKDSQNIELDKEYNLYYFK